MNWPMLDWPSFRRRNRLSSSALGTDIAGQNGPCGATTSVESHSKACRANIPCPGEVLRPEIVSPRFLDRVPRDFARRHLIVSQGQSEDGAKRMAITELTNPAAFHNIGVLLQVRLTPSIADGEAIARLIDEVYGHADQQRITVADEATMAVLAGEDIDRLLQNADRDLLSTEGKGPVIKLVDALIFEALGRNASDVHVQPIADRTLVRYRLDGVLHTVRELPRNLTNPVISRIKVMGRMDITERRMPQDGRASVVIGPRDIDMRISTLPTSYGERAVIRLLDNSNHLCDFDRIGMPSEVARPYLDRAGRANGMVLLTGPTGSGKTTTLYSTLRRIGISDVGGGVSGGLNIMTIEDPVEYELSDHRNGLAISQSQVNPRKGVTFATGLRHILRQDPDVIMVGEIRDGETARIAIQSSLTGHLVFSTLHTNDAPSAVTRLIDLGIEPYLVSASLSAVLAQRLVRKTHLACNGGGCDECLKTGFRWRTGLFELLCVDQRISELISGHAPLNLIRQAARAPEPGAAIRMRTLREDGERLVAAGITTLAEVLRVVQGAGE